MDSDPRPTAVAALHSVWHYAPFDEVAAAVSLATEHETRVYAERKGDRYRWSLLHNGGPYPLLRVAARFLGEDYRRILIGYRTLASGETVLFDDRADTDPAEVWKVMAFSGSTDQDEVALRLLLELA